MSFIEPGVKREGTPSAATSSSGDQLQKKVENVACDSNDDIHSSTVLSAGIEESSNVLTSLHQDHETSTESTKPVGGIANIGTTRMRPIKAETMRRRQKVKELNDLISCYLCRGYLINATTIDYCIHSFCRSCILKHLQEDKHCPKCKLGGKPIGLSNLRTDERLKSLIFKLVPGLYQREHQRQMQFHSEMISSNKGDECEDTADMYPFDADEEYFSPVEPISLSLEYHPQSLQNYSKKMIPPVRYLQCPAAVTMHHIKRFISSKFDIDSHNERVDIEIIYEDEVLPEDFSLMDVGYCYSWKRITPMRFFYRILVHNLCNKSNQSIPCDSALSEGENAIEAKRTKKFNEGGPQKSVRFKEINDNQTIDKSTSSGDILAVLLEDTQVNLPKLKIKSNKDEVNTNIKCTMSNNNINNNIENDSKSKTLTNVVTKNESEMNGGKGPVKMTIFARRTSEGKIKMENTKVKSKSKPLAPFPGGNAKTSQVISDFKSLRSNDIRYSDYTLSTSQAAVLNSTSTGKEKGDVGAMKTNTTSSNNIQKPVTKNDIVVCIPPQAHAHRSSNSSDDSFENLSLAQLKTANKKITSVQNQKQSKEMENGGRILKTDDKLKIDVPKLKITVPRISPDTHDTKKNSKTRKLSVEDQTQKCSPVIDVDLTTYAKNIGLKPINPIPTERKKSVSSESASSTPSSASACSPQSSLGHAFIFSEGTDSPPHKKRKKAKHSKESKEPSSKRRKLHAEISSQPADESLKLKVKITGNHRSYKAEKKANANSIGEKDTPSLSTSKSSLALSTESVNVANAVATVPIREVAENSSNIANSAKSIQDNLLQESSKLANRNKQGLNIPNLNKILSEESSTINSLIKENSSKQDNAVQNNVKVSTTLSKTKPSTVTSSKGSTPSTVGNANVASASFCSKTQIPKKSHPPKIANIPDTKIPISPPLPPSLFKTAPMTIPTLAPPNLIKPLQPRFPTSTDLRPIPIQSQMKRPTNFPALKNQGNFVVPNPPRNLSNSSKLCTITSIASSANRQAAQLKRSASLDGNPTSLQKQQKMDHGRTNRKSSYAPFIAQATPSTNFPASNIGIKQQSNSSSVVITTATGSKVTEQQTFYTSTMGPTYTREIISRKQMPIIVPPSSISVTKMSDVISSKLSCPTSSVTITPQQSLQSSQFQQQNQKPALEIVRISSNIPPIDQQPLTVTNNNTVKQNPPKTTRPPPPPIPLVKIKRTLSQAAPLKSAITTVPAPTQQSSYLSKVKVSSTTVSVPTTTANNTTSAKTPATVTPNGQSPVCDKIGALDLSGKSSRSPSQEESTPTNTPPDTPTQKPPKDASIANKQTDLNLQAALKKLSQQISNIAQTSLASQASTTTQSSAISTTSTDRTTKSSTATLASVEASAPSPSSQTPQKVPEPNNGLQNLKMLSESATSREKITIKNQRLLPMLPKLNEINKTRANPTVRHQNPSVRNIPNPSALAFRSQQPIPMLASITKTASPIKLLSTSATIAPTTATTTPTTSVVSKVSDSTTPKSSSETTTTSSTLAAISSPNISPVASSTTDSSKLKKNLHLEQLAASLNLRALSAAAADASKLSNTTCGTDTKGDTNNSNSEDSTTKATPVAPPPTVPTSSPNVTSSSDNTAVVTSTSLNGVAQQSE